MAVSAVECSGSDRGEVTSRRGVRTYALQWPLQFLAGLSIAIVAQAMAIRVNSYTSLFATGSALLMAIGYSLTFFAFCPAAPLGGRLADRWGPKKILLASNIGYLVLIMISLASLAAGVLPGWLVWVILLGRTASQSVQITALAACVPVLIPKRHISQANGSRMFLTTAVAAFEIPVAFALLPVIGLRAIILVTSVVVIAAIAFLARAEIPSARLLETAAAGAVTIRRGYQPLWAYVRGRRGLVALLGLFAVFNFVVGFAEIADRAITQSFGSPATLNIVLGAGVTGMLATTVGITVWGTPRRAVRWLLIFSVALTLALVLGATRPNLLLVAAAAVLFLGSAPFIMAITSTLLHTKTEPALMGRMMGLQTLVIGITYGAGNVVGGLCAAFTKPLIGGHRLSTGFLTDLVGTGWAYGRGYAVMAMMVAVVAIVIVLLLGRHPSLRQLDTNLPDVTPEDLLRRPAPPEPRPRATGQQQAAPRPVSTRETT